MTFKLPLFCASVGLDPSRHLNDSVKINTLSNHSNQVIIQKLLPKERKIQQQQIKSITHSVQAEMKTLRV